jgi:para-aminobenzoate synthetase component 1
MKLDTAKLPYLANTSLLLSQLRRFNGLVALESDNSDHENGRWSIISAGPVDTFRTTDRHCSDEILETLESLYSKLPKKSHELPFVGGLLGHVSYDLGLPSLNKPLKQLSFKEQPKILVGLYTWAFVIDHQEKVSHLIYWTDISLQDKSELLQIFNNSFESLAEDFQITAEFSPLWSKYVYKQKIQAIHNYIQNGDCYQINLAQCFKATYRGDSLAAYARLRKVAQVPYASYFDDTEMSFASLSPEMFITCDNNNVITKPIKGTQPRSPSAHIDEQNKQLLKESTKDQAENVMIVDLLRNDLSKNASQVKVPKLFDVESFSTVHHLVSTITAKINPDTSVLKLFLDAFPGGSITGTPKKRAMEIISELEEFPRSFYCGSSFYYSCNGKFSSNILIRSFLFQQGDLFTWSGGGIIADSTWQLEYQESLDKISRLMASLQR